MARFDPTTYPDRVAFHANACRIRATELAKLADAVAAWLDGHRRNFTGRAASFAPVVSAHSRRHSAR
jgi:hypothetical protein